MSVDSTATPAPEVADAETAAFVERMLVAMPPDDTGGPTLPPVIPGLTGFVEVDRGGTGTIWRATRVADGRTVAVKILHAAGSMGRSACARARREAELLAELDHPGIVRIESSGEMRGAPGWPDGLPWLVMEWVPGDTLQRHVARRSPGTHEAVRIARDLARALEAVHARGIVHRDVKPANVVLTDGPAGPAPKLVDFGLARDEDAGESLTRSGAVVGTPGYMAAEQTGRDDALGAVGPATDIHGLGGTLFFMLHRRPPHEGRTIAESFARAVTGAVDWTPPPGGPIPGPLRAILETCLDRLPVRRYPSAAALAADLDRFLDGRPVRARRRPWPARIVASVGGRRLSVAATLVAAAMTLALGAGAWWHARRLDAVRAAAEAARDVSRLSLARLTDDSVSRMIARGPAFDPADLAYLRRVQGLYMAMPLEPDRRAALSERIAGLERLAGIFAKIHRIDDATACYRAALDDATRLGREGDGLDETARLRIALLRAQGTMLADAGRAADAEGTFRLALAVAEAWPAGNPAERELLAAAVTLDLGIVVDRADRPAEARELLDAGLQTLARLRRAAPDDFDVARRELEALLSSAAGVSPGTVSPDVRRGRLDVLIALAEEAKERFPFEHATLSRLEILGMAALVDLESETGNHAQSLSMARCLRALVRGDLESRPDDSFLRGEAIEAGVRESLATTRLGRPDESAALLEDALARARSDRAAEPAVLRHAGRLAKTLQTSAMLHRAAGRPEAAIAALRELIDVLAPWADATDSAGFVCPMIAGARGEIGYLLLRHMGDPAGAVESLGAAIAMMPGPVRPDLALLLAEASLATGDVSAAREAAVTVADHPDLGAHARALLDSLPEPETPGDGANE